MTVFQVVTGYGDSASDIVESIKNNNIYSTAFESTVPISLKIAVLNADGGQIIIGVSDDGNIVGVEKIDETLKKISDVITMQIEPNPQEEIRTELKFDSGKTLIVLYVSKGTRNIYCQKKYGFSSSGCSIRIGTTCKEMTAEQIRVRYEKNFYDEEYMIKKRASRSDLTF